MIKFNALFKNTNTANLFIETISNKGYEYSYSKDRNIVTVNAKKSNIDTNICECDAAALTQIANATNGLMSVAF